MRDEAVFQKNVSMPVISIFNNSYAVIAGYILSQ